MKTCIRCKKSKTLNEFGKDKYTKDGYKSHCKKCPVSNKEKMTIIDNGIEKTCTKCKETKHINEFVKDKSKKNGLRPSCKACAREIHNLNKEHHRIRRNKYYTNHKEEAAQRRLLYFLNPENQIKKDNARFKRTYGITIKDRNEMFESQKGKCAICNIHERDLNKKLSIDHDHISKFVRGLLCDKCNRGLGFFNENIELLNMAIVYLKECK